MKRLLPYFEYRRQACYRRGGAGLEEEGWRHILCFFSREQHRR